MVGVLLSVTPAMRPSACQPKLLDCSNESLAITYHATLI
jgi:hypothetical protein